MKAFNTLQNDKILDMKKFKAFADDKLDVARMTISFYHRVKNTLGKGEKEKMLATILFSFSHSVFQSLLLEGR